MQNDGLMRAHPAVWPLLTAFVLFASYAGTADAQLDPESNQPYQLHVVVRIAKDVQLTPIFQERVQRSLQDSLQGALGYLAQVKVVTTHPLLDQIEKQGLQQVLAGWKSVSGVTTHFVLIDYQQGLYQIQAMQHDGFTGLASPVLRRAETTDREIVARMAGLLIDRDLGVAGTVGPVSSGAEVTVTLKGGGLGVPLNRWLKKDQVLAIARIQQAGKELRSERVEDALLRVVEEPDARGVCRCKLEHRRQEPLGRKALGYRCVKLGTGTAELRLKVVDQNTYKPLSGVTVHISQQGFEVTEESPVTNTEGMIVSKKQYTNIAFVRLFTGQLLRAKIPIEVIEGRLAVCPLLLSAQAEVEAELDLQRRRLESDLNDTIQVLNATVSDLKNAKDPAVQLDKVKAALAYLAAEIDSRGLELRNLANRIKTERLKISLENPESRLGILKKSQGDLVAFVGQLEEAIKKANDPRQAELARLAGQAEQEELNADFDKALKTYQDIIDKSADLNPELRKQAETRLQELRARWNPKSEAHKQAKDYIYTKWPDLQTPSQLKTGLTAVRKAFDVCRKENDFLTPRKLLLVSVKHATSLTKFLDTLGKDEQQDVEQLKLGSAVADELGKLITDVNKYLENAPKK